MASNKKVQFEFSMKSDTFNNNLKETQRQLKETKNEIMIANDGIKQFGASAETLAKKYEAINKAIEQNNKTINLYKQEMDKLKKTNDDHVKSLDDIAQKRNETKKQYDEAIKLYGKESDEAKKLEKELDSLKNQYVSKEKAIDGNVKKMENYSTKISDATRECSYYETQLKELNKEIDNNSNKFLMAQQKLESAGKTLTTIGDGIDSASNKILAFSTPIAVAGVAIAKMSVDFESSLAKVNTLLSGSNIDIETYKNQIIALSNETGKDVNVLSEALYEALSAGVDASEAMLFLKESNKLATAGFTDNAKATDLLTTTLNAYDIKVTETAKVSDILMQVQNKGKTTIDQLASSMGKVIPTANANSVSLEQLGASYALLTANGIATAESTTYINSMLNELGKTGSKTDTALRELTGKSFKELMESGTSLTDVLGMLSVYAKDSGLNLTDLFGSAEAGKAVLTLTKNEGNDFNEMLKSMQESVGTTDEAFKKIEETTGNKLTKALTNLKNSFIEAGDNLAPSINKISDAIVKVSEAIAEMDDETISNTLKLAGWGVALGATGKVVGGTVSTVGTLATGLSKLSGLLASTSATTTTLGTAGTMASTGLGGSGLTGALAGLSTTALPVVAVVGALATGFYAIHEANDVMKSSVVKSKDEFSLMEKGMANLMGVQLRSREELEKTNLIYKEFSGSISQEFKESVSNMREDINNFNLSISEIKLDGVFSQEESDAITTRVETMLNNVITQIDSNKTEIEGALNDSFAVDGVFDDKEKQIIEWWQNRGTKEKDEAQRLANEINEIEKTAFAEGRVLTNEEEKAIMDRYARISQIELIAKSKNNEELIYAEKEFQGQVKTLSAEEASKLIQQKISEANDLLEQDRIKIETQKAIIMQGYSEMSDQDKQYADDAIKALDDAYKTKEQATRNHNDNLYKLAIDSNENLEGELDRYTGNVFTKEDEFYSDRLKKLTSNYKDIQNITESGNYKVYDNNKKTWTDVSVTIDEKTGEIIGIYDHMSGAFGGYSKEIGLQTQQVGVDYKNMKSEIEKSFGDINSATVNNKNIIKNSSGEVIGQLKDVVKEADGTRTGILNLNGTPIKVTVDKWGTISAIDDIKTAIDRIPSQKQVSIVVKGGNTMQAYATGSAGTTEDSIATVNEKGFETYTSMYGQQPLSLGSNLDYIPEGTKINSNLTSVQQMKAEISKEVNRVLSLQNTNKSKEKVANNIKVELGGITVNGDVSKDNLSEIDNMMKQQEERIYKNISKQLNSR